MGVETPKKNFSIFISSLAEKQKPNFKMSEAEAKDAFIIFDEAYEGNDVDAFYVGDILRALGCNVTNAAVVAAGGAAELGQKRVAFTDFLPILAAVKADTSSAGCKEDYIEGLRSSTRTALARSPLLRSSTFSPPSVRSWSPMRLRSSSPSSDSSLMRTT